MATQLSFDYQQAAAMPRRRVCDTSRRSVQALPVEERPFILK